MNTTIDSGQYHKMKLSNHAVNTKNERNDSLALDRTILSNDHRNNRSFSGNRVVTIEKVASEVINSGRNNQVTRTQRTHPVVGEHCFNEDSSIGAGQQMYQPPNRQLFINNTNQESQYRTQNEYQIQPNYNCANNEKANAEQSSRERRYNRNLVQYQPQAQTQNKFEEATFNAPKQYEQYQTIKDDKSRE